MKVARITTNRDLDEKLYLSIKGAGLKLAAHATTSISFDAHILFLQLKSRSGPNK